ncbi:MAG: hypothetical protein OXR84_03365 [Magnetovibrio sp.]|nr:hypothetical protein [Magnetovibrio sp.]
MADEIDAGQERGELTTGGGTVGRGNGEQSTIADLGLRRDQVHDFRKIRDAGIDAVEEIILSENLSP